jgi:LysR family transcriptional regulator, nitrogen assimilation regulatory protein
MDLRQLRYFVGAIQAGSLSRAADQLHVAQSALSHHLASLESELDIPLVIRGPRGIILTEAGGILYRHAEAILRHLESAKQATKSALNVPSGRVSIGFPAVLAPLLSYELFRRVRSAYPEILMYVGDAPGWLLRERLVNSRLDIAMLFVDHPERGIAVEPLVLEELFYVTADLDASPIRIVDAARRPLLLAASGSSSRHVIQSAFNKHGLTITPAAEIDTISMLCRAIASGMGNSIMPWCALHDGDGKIALNYRRFADANLVRPVALCFSDTGQHTPAVEAVAETLKSLVRELVESGTWQGVSLIEPEPRPVARATR